MIDYWSQSRLNMISRCPKQFYYRYILGLKIPPNAPMTFGTSYHRTLEANFRYKIHSECDMPKDMVETIFSDEWERHSAEIEWAMEDPNFASGWYKDKGIGLVGVYIDKIAPGRLPIAVELDLEVQIRGVDKPLVGIIDFVGQGNYILEHKTAKKRWNQARADSSLQASAYFLLYKGAFGERPTKLVYDIALKYKNPQVDTIETGRSEQQLDNFVDRIKVAQDLVAEEIFPETSPDNWYCSERWCGYYPHCMRGVPLNQLRLMKAEENDDFSGAI